MNVEVVCTSLCRLGYWTQAWRLSRVVSVVLRRRIERLWAIDMIRGKHHPLDGLAHSNSHLKRHCIMQLILDEPECLPPSGAMLKQTMNDMSELIFVFSDQMATTLKDIKRTPYTYQLVERDRAKKDEKRVNANGEVAHRVFMSFANAGKALEFTEAWIYAQVRTEPQRATCLLECGTYDETLRKWVLDVDASVAELKKASMWLGEAELHKQTMDMAIAVSNALYELKFLYRPCHFSMTSRHTTKKMSWHITLNALANHERWREALDALDSKPLGSMYTFVDKGTRNNTKSQYMQVRGSTKVVPGAKADGHFFKDVGLFDGNGVQVQVPIERYSILFYAATSVVLHDPWSLPFVPCEPKEPKVMQPKKRKREPIRVGPTVDSTEFGAITNWSGVIAQDAVWMRALVERTDGTTRLVSIPSMANPQYWCETVVRLINVGRGVLRVYAKVMNPRLCPKTLKGMHQVHCHGTNHSMLVVVEEKHPMCKGTSFRMFMRCFSEKCRAIKTASGYGWIELDKSDYLMARLMTSGC